MERHTYFSLSYFLCHGAKDRKDLNHGIYDDFGQSRGRLDHYILFKSLKKALHATEEIDKSILASPNILDGLGNVFSRTPT